MKAAREGGKFKALAREIDLGGAPAAGGKQAMRRRERLLREIGAALALKILALGVLYVAFFAPPHGARLTSEGVSAHLLSPLGPSMER